LSGRWHRRHDDRWPVQECWSLGRESSLLAIADARGQPGLGINVDAHVQTRRSTQLEPYPGTSQLNAQWKHRIVSKREGEHQAREVTLLAGWRTGGWVWAGDARTRARPIQLSDANRTPESGS
jgi:hypothetical protein